MKKIKVLIVDDSAVVREILEKGLSSDPEIEVVGKAADVYIARDKIVYKQPDVMTLDVEMPKMDGVEFLKKLMPQYPLPVIMVSSMTAEGAQVTLDALQAGAVDFVLKPDKNVGFQLNDMMQDLILKVKAASKADVSHYKKSLNNITSNKGKTKTVSHVLKGTTDKIIAIGASTGGTVALRKMLEQFPPDMPGTVIVQHMPANFTKMFARSLNEISKMEVKEAKDGDRIITGRVLIAPGGLQMQVKRSGGNYIVHCKESEKVSGHAPSVDVLFDSVSSEVGSNAIGVILTGMGRDGAKGLLKMRESGANTIAQDESSCVVFGMPGEAHKLGAAQSLEDINDITAKIIEYLNRM